VSGYFGVEDILPCHRTKTGLHDWIDYRQDSDSYYTGECSHCAALLRRFWWGWEFRTGEEHFEDARVDYDALRAPTGRAPPHLRGGPRDAPGRKARLDRIPVELEELL
jgi:hypothetical protein